MAWLPRRWGQGAVEVVKVSRALRMKKLVVVLVGAGAEARVVVSSVRRWRLGMVEVVVSRALRMTKLVVVLVGAGAEARVVVSSVR